MLETSIKVRVLKIKIFKSLGIQVQITTVALWVFRACLPVQTDLWLPVCSPLEPPQDRWLPCRCTCHHHKDWAFWSLGYTLPGYWTCGSVGHQGWLSYSSSRSPWPEARGHKLSIQMSVQPNYWKYFDLIWSNTYPWIGTDAAVKGGVVASNGKGVDQRLCELWRLLEVMVFEIMCFHLQACGGKGKGMGLFMILVLSGIMWGIPCVVRDRQRILFIISGA